MDAASSEWKSEKGKGYYKLPKAGTEYTAEQLIEHWAALCEKYPIILSKMVLMKRTGKAGRNLQQDLATRFSSLVMTFS